MKIGFIPPSLELVFNVEVKQYLLSLTLVFLFVGLEAGPVWAASIIPNWNLEIASPTSSSTPEGWIRGRWGTNTAVFSYPTTSFDNSRAAEVTLTSYTSGDAKWAPNPVGVSAGRAYEFKNNYKSNIPSFVTVQFIKSDGSTSYLDIGNLASSNNSWTEFRAIFTVPASVASLTIFHVIKSVGSLAVDNYSLSVVASDPAKFDKGYVSLNFDDGYRSTYNNAVPILDAAGFKSDQFIVTSYVSGNFPAYINKDQLLTLQAHGHVIGAHTRTHPDLTTISQADAEIEIRGSREDLVSWGATPVNIFGYPFGAYNTSIQNLVRSIGFSAGRSSDGGYNDKRTSPYALRRQSMLNTTTLAEVKNYIDTARANKTWVILLFHEVDTNGHRYAVTPTLFGQIVDYLREINMTPITVEEGVRLMQGS